jgi:hypothetical protein
MSGLELKEFAEIVDAGEARRGREQTTEEDLQRALQALLVHQCVYSDRPIGGRAYTIIMRHRDFFEKYVGALNYKLVVEQRDGLAAIRPKSSGFGWRENRLKKDETFVLLVLRYIFEDTTRRGEMDETGRVETNTDEIYDAYKTLSGTEPPTESRMKDILWMCKQRGLVRPGDPDRGERITPVTVLPGIRVVITDTFVEAVIDWVEKGAVDSEESFFDRLHTHLEGDEANDSGVEPGADTADADTYEGNDDTAGGDIGDDLEIDPDDDHGETRDAAASDDTPATDRDGADAPAADPQAGNH